MAVRQLPIVHGEMHGTAKGGHMAIGRIINSVLIFPVSLTTGGTKLIGSNQQLLVVGCERATIQPNHASTSTETASKEMKRLRA